jgi:hypothetical protein
MVNRRVNLILAEQLDDNLIKEIALQVSKLDDTGKQVILDMLVYIVDARKRR